MKNLSRNEIISIIEGKGAADRVPMIYGLWTNPDTFGQNSDKAREYLREYPDDVRFCGMRMPDIWNAPPEAPSYRWMHRDRRADETGSRVYDANIVLESWDELDALLADFPSPDEPFLWQNIGDDGRYKVANWWYWLFERHWSLRGMENALTDFYLYPDETHRLYAALTDFYCGMARNAKKYYNADGFFVSDDIGTQTGPFFSLDIFREFFKPYYKKLIDCVHSLGMHMWLHACGNIELFLPELIEIGLDVIHPIQKYTMSEEEIAKQFGNDICIFAGFDVQRIIPYGTPEEVRKEIRFLIDTYSRPEGRLMLTMGNGITPDCPIESLYAVLSESFLYGTEKLKAIKS